MSGLLKMIFGKKSKTNDSFKESFYVIRDSKNGKHNGLYKCKKYEDVKLLPLRLCFFGKYKVVKFEEILKNKKYEFKIKESDGKYTYDYTMINLDYLPIENNNVNSVFYNSSK